MSFRDSANSAARKVVTAFKVTAGAGAAAALAYGVASWTENRARESAELGLIRTSQLPSKEEYGCSGDYISRAFGFGGCQNYYENTFTAMVNRGQGYNTSSYYNKTNAFGQLADGYSLEGSQVSWTDEVRNSDRQKRIVGEVILGSLDVEKIPAGKEITIDLKTGKVSITQQVFSAIENNGVKSLSQNDETSTIDLGGPVKFSGYAEYPKEVQAALRHIVTRIDDDFTNYAKTRDNFIKYFSRDHAFRSAIAQCKVPSVEGYEAAVKEITTYGNGYKAPNFLSDAEIAAFKTLAAELKAELEANPKAFDTLPGGYDSNFYREGIFSVIEAYNLNERNKDLKLFDPRFTNADVAAINEYFKAHCSGEYGAIYPTATPPQL